MTISERATIMEQSTAMYSTSDNTILYWKDWAEKFIKCCKEKMGWEVEVGPGTSLGVLMPMTTWNWTYGFNTNSWYRNSYDCSAWDCDWTQPDGIYKLYQKDNDNHEGCPRYTGWFKEYPTWPEGANENGIDTTGRFDFVVYVGVGTNGEKIGFRIKYPVCSIGYSYRGSNNGDRVPGNFLYGVPSISLYSSAKGDIENYYPETLNNTAYSVSYDTDYYENFIPAKGYVSFFYKERLTKPGYNTTLSYWGKTDESNSSYPYSTTQLISPLWTLDLQKDENFTRNSTGANGIVPNRLFKNYWIRFNKFHWHFSKAGDTAYMYVSDDVSHDVGIKIITMTLESGEKAIMIERRQWYETNCLCEVAAVTGNDFNNPSQPESNKLIRLPMRPYTKYSSQINRFSLSRMLLPTQTSLCTDLYYVTKRDCDETIGDGQYVIVKDKQSENHYFRIIPFGSRYTYEETGDNTTYLAFPVIDPPKDDSGD